jgi:prephenate dehydrogenase
MIFLSNNHHLHIVGLGLIGASVAGALKDTPYKVTGWDHSEQIRAKALDRELVDDLHSPDSYPESVSGVLLAVPVPEMSSVVDDMLKNSVKPRFVTDVGSTKQQVCDEMNRLLPDDVPFIGAHPMAGSEESGLSASDPILFENAICVITPTEPNQRHLLDVIQLWETIGAHVLEMTPSEHDRSVAYVSHLPHINAAGLLHGARTVPDHESNVLPLAAGGFRDTTRVAEGAPDLWRDILQTNQDQILDAIDNFIDNLQDARTMIDESSWDELTNWLESAKSVRDQIPEKTKGLIGSIFELKILAPDKPGILAHITTTLAEASINISDIEVLRVREGERGSIKLGFRRQEELSKARNVLQESSEDIEII